MRQALLGMLYLPYYPLAPSLGFNPYFASIPCEKRLPPFRFEALREGWIKTSRNFTKLNEHCATGEPSRASVEKGQKYLDLVIGRISQFLIELAESPLDESFPHRPDKKSGD